jgi:putative transposase
MDMVRAGVVSHPEEWSHSGYQEIQAPPKRYSMIDIHALMELGGFHHLETLQKAHREWVTAELQNDKRKRQAYWTESVAVGSEQYLIDIQDALGASATSKACKTEGEVFILKEPEMAYSSHFIVEKDGLRY